MNVEIQSDSSSDDNLDTQGKQSRRKISAKTNKSLGIN